VTACGGDHLPLKVDERADGVQVLRAVNGVGIVGSLMLVPV
jgi:hypothetical protein